MAPHKKSQEDKSRKKKHGYNNNRMSVVEKFTQKKMETNKNLLQGRKLGRKGFWI